MLTNPATLPVLRIVPIGQFARSQSTPKGMSATEPFSKAVQNMSVPNTPDRTGQNGDWQRWPSVYSEAPDGSLANVRYTAQRPGGSTAVITLDESGQLWWDVGKD